MGHAAMGADQKRYPSRTHALAYTTPRLGALQGREDKCLA